jgi:hypothetical protein
MAMVKRATSGTHGTPDWSTILQILGKFETHPESIATYIDEICSVLVTGTRPVRMNTLILIDALFKNLKRPQLCHLQTSGLCEALSESFIANNPELQNFVYKSAPAWTSCCVNHNCLDPAFAAWQESACRSHFVPKLTPIIRNKLFADIESAYELLVMFSECLTASFEDGGSADDILLREIFPNVCEVKKRIFELEPTISDRFLKVAVHAIAELSEYCCEAMNGYRKTQKLDLDGLSRAVNAADGVIGRAQKRESSEVNPYQFEKVVTRRRGAGQDDMSTEEFFRRFDELKKRKEPESVVDLLGFGGRDDEIDSLIDF